MPGNYPEESKQ